MNAKDPQGSMLRDPAASSPADRRPDLRARLKKHFSASAKAASAVAGVAAAGGLSAAVISWVPPGGITIPLSTSGVYINVETQVFGTAAATPGWDLNPWSSTNLNWFNPSAPAGGVYHIMPGGVGISNLPLGYTIPGTGTWGSGASTAAGTGVWTFNSSDNYVGFRFNAADGLTRFGYARVELGASFTDAARKILEIHYESVAGAPITIGAAPPPVPGAACGPYTSNPGIAIPTGAPPNIHVDQINIGPLPPNTLISDLNVFVNITHSWGSDLRVSLTSPMGTTIDLVGAGYCGSHDNLVVEFDDSAAGLIGSVCPMAGFFIPTQALSAFNNEPLQGLWTMTVSDVASGDGGTWNSWCLMPTTYVPPPGSGCGPYTSNPGIAIPTGAPPNIHVDQINIGPLPPNTLISDLNVFVNITHTWGSDLRVSLTSPMGTTIDLVGAGYCGSQDNLVVEFDDSAAGLIGSACPMAGYFIPTQALSAFNNEPLEGLWTMTVSDVASGDGGTWHSWCLMPTTYVLACTPPVGTAVAVNAGCASYEIQVDVTDIGDSPGGVDILVDGISVVTPPVGTGSYGPFGPYANGSAHTVTLVHLGDATCNVDLPVSSTFNCPDPGCSTCDYYECIANSCVLISPSNSGNFPGTGAGPIPDNAPTGIDIDIPVSGVTGTVNSIKLNLTGIVHPWVGDLRVTLTSPASVTHEMFMRVGAAGCDGVGNSSDLNGDYSFSDNASTTLWSAAVAAGGGANIIPGGCYRTTGCALGNVATSMLATFSFPAPAGPNVNGNWTLNISDNAAADVGSIAGASLDVCWTAASSCTTDLFFVHDNTTNDADLVWTVYRQSDDGVEATGGINPGEGSVPLCLPDGDYYLRVTNSGGNVISGGYRLVLKDAVGTYGNARIIDDTDNLVLGPGGDSGIAGNQGFTIPLGDDEPLYTSCDRYWWKSGEYLVSKENPTVSAEFGGPNAGNSGYEFWFYDPNGGLSFRKTRVHTVSDGFAPNNAVRACHIKLNNWAAVNQLVDGTLYNVRLRGVVAGNPLGEFGPACRVTLDPVLNACPPTGLNDIPGNPNYSCGVTRTFGGPNSASNRLFARPVAGANLYEWEFTNDPNEPAYYVTRQTTGVQRHLNWVTEPAMSVGNTYRVRVRASKNNGVTWCDWGWTCEVTIVPSAAPGNENIGLEGDAASHLALWPNPNNGQQVWITLDELAAEVSTVAVDLFDLSGKRVLAREIATQGGHLYTNIDLGGLAAGTYLVTITAGDEQHVRRLVVQP